jgi:1-acyl-sn-glycerol-3-phosphate acyltransferase
VKQQVYKDPRPAEHFDRFHERQRSKRPNLMYEFVRMLLTPYLMFFYRARCIDSHNIPAEGPVIRTRRPSGPPTPCSHVATSW